MSRAEANRRVNVEHKERQRQNVQAMGTNVFTRQVGEMRDLLAKMQTARPDRRRTLREQLLGLSVVKLAANVPRTPAGRRQATKITLPLEEIDGILAQAATLVQRPPSPKTYNLRPTIKSKLKGTVARGEYSKAFR